MKIIINNQVYQVRKNYLHRGENPRLVLELKEVGQFVSIQFNERIEELKQGKEYTGYWCNKNGHSDIIIKLV